MAFKIARLAWPFIDNGCLFRIANMFWEFRKTNDNKVGLKDKKIAFCNRAARTDIGELSTLKCRFSVIKRELIQV